MDNKHSRECYNLKFFKCTHVVYYNYKFSVIRSNHGPKFLLGTKQGSKE